MPSRSNNDAEKFSWGRTARSPLVRQILLGLVGVALVELIFICCIGYCLFQSADAAEREFQLLQASSRLVNVLRAGRELWAQATRLRRNVVPSEYEAYRREYAQLLAQVDLVSTALQRAQVDADIVGDARRSLNELDVQTETIYRRKMLGELGEVDYQAWKIPSMSSLEQSVKLVVRVHEIIREHTQEIGHFERMVLLILILSVLINLIIVAFGYRAIRSRITQPIANLASNCDRILEGEVIQPGDTLAMNEITSLERAFRMMSMDLSENTKRRKNFQNLFRDVLMTGLLRIDNDLSTALQCPLPEHRSILEKNVERCKKGLAPLIAMLDWLSESLASEKEEDLRIVCKPVEIQSIIDQSILAVESLAREKEVILIQQIGQFNTTVDEQLIRRVLINLLSNAIKFSPQKGEIEVTVDEQGDWWQMSIRDHGKGIPEEAKSRLFTRFGTLHKASEQPRDGTGLGLVICKQIVEAHGGKIWCDSVVGSGTTFSTRVPKEARATSSSSPNTAATAPTDTRTGIGKNRRHIAHYYSILLLLLVVVQTGIIALLNHELGQIHKQTAKFSAQKEGLIAAQDTLSKLIQDRYNVIDACKYGDIATAKQIIKRIDPAIGRIRASLSYADSTAESIVEHMAVSEKELITLAEALPKNPERLSKLQQAALFQPAKTIYDNLADDCFTLMNIQQSALESSFAITTRLRIQVAAIIVLTLLFDLTIFTLAVKRTLTLIGRTEQLSDQVRAFGEGTAPQRTDAASHDELSLLEERFCESASQLQMIEDRRQTLMAVVNHDLRTPVTSMLLTLEMTVAGVPERSPPQLMQNLRAAEKELESVFNKINDFLLIERLSRSSYQPEFEQLALDEIFAGVASLMSARGLIDSSRIVSDAEDLDLDWIVMGDRRLLESMFFHLLRNACDYSEPGSTVTVNWSRSDDGRIRIAVQNQGQRINSKLLPQMFERYRSIDGAAMTGIGLPMLAQVTKVHHGDVQLASNTLAACTCEVFLPSALSAPTIEPKPLTQNT